jgi:hypothetical protein
MVTPTDKKIFRLSKKSARTNHRDIQEFQSQLFRWAFLPNKTVGKKISGAQ